MEESVTAIFWLMNKTKIICVKMFHGVLIRSSIWLQLQQILFVVSLHSMKLKTQDNHASIQYFNRNNSLQPRYSL